MIGKKEWFQRRKYSGWGLTPKTWQGWVYIALIMLPFIIFQSLPFWQTNIRLAVTAIWIAFLLIDTFHIMINLNGDERENKIEALAERNSSWAMMIILVMGILYQTISAALNQKLEVDLFLVTALVFGAIVKSVSNYILKNKNL